MPYGNLNVDTVTTSTANGVLGAGNASIMKNRIINGSFVIDQRNAGASVTPNNGYTLDRWAIYNSQTGKLTVQQNAGSVTPPAGFTNYLGITSTSAYSIGASDYFTLRQSIEGFNVADLGFGTANAKTFTLSFQVYSSLTGTFGGVVKNGAETRSYPFTYSIPVANTWTTISLTFAGDTTGTWAKTNTSGLILDIGLGVGSAYSGTAGSWQTIGVISATGATSVVGTNGATFYITGVQLEVGSSATGYEYRQYGQELALCQRYYAKMSSTVSNGACGAGLARSSTASNIFIKLPVTMRTIPTVSYSSAYLNYNSDVYQLVNSNSGVQGGTDSINYFPNSSTASMTTGYPVLLAIGSGGYVDFSSEL
jgi:hypothetical protein